MLRWLVRKKYSLALAVGSFMVGALCFSFCHSPQKSRVQVLGFPKLDYGHSLVCYDSARKIPQWTYEYLDVKNRDRPPKKLAVSFKENKAVYSLHRSTIKDYKQSGLDRGHMMAAANWNQNEKDLSNTFLLSNVCPQNAGLNRGVWAALEKKIRQKIAPEQPVEVVTGPLFLPHLENGNRFVKYQVIGENHVAVPTHFFKLIYFEQKPTAYIIPNHDLPLGTQLDQFLVPIDLLEKVSGLQFSFQS